MKNILIRIIMFIYFLFIVSAIFIYIKSLENMIFFTNIIYLFLLTGNIYILIKSIIHEKR